MESLYIFQKGFNFSQDGPGNRLVYHLSGCSLHCPWCSNPEGLARGAGTKLTVEEIVAEAVSAKPMFFSGGGVTLTGGEVTEQYAAVEELLKRLKQEGIHTCIETNGTHPRLPELAKLVDYLIMDIKHYDDEMHRKVIGISNKLILENLQKLSGRQLALRIPLIGGFNASQENARGFAKLLKGLDVTLELLRYHEYGVDKYAALGIPYTMTKEARITDEVYKNFVSILTEEGITLIRS